MKTLHTLTSSAYARMTEKVVDFLNYDTTKNAKYSLFQSFMNVSISNCKPHESDYGYLSVNAAQHIHLNYLKRNVPEVYFLCMVYLYHVNARVYGHEITEDQLDDICYEAFYSLSDKLYGLSNKHDDIRSPYNLHTWLLSYEFFVDIFIETWWSDIAGHIDSENLTQEIGNIYEHEFPRLERVVNKLIKNNVPFMSVISHIILASGRYGTSSGVHVFYCLHQENSDCSKFVTERNKSGNLDEPERYTKILCKAITEEYMEKELTVLMLWLKKIDNLLFTTEQFVVISTKNY